jgi:hypothetical protein
LGICLALCQIDHEGIVEGALPLVNDAIRSGELAPLRAHLKSLAFDESDELAERLRQRVAALRELDAPVFLIEGTERRLANARRPEPATIDLASLDELRELVGGWCREARSLDLDKSWDLIHWYSDPVRRERADGDWRSRLPGFTPSPFDYAVHGHEPYPQGSDGQPVIRTGGDPDSSWYNPPAVVTEIAEAVRRVAVDDWPAIDRALRQVPRDAQPYLADCDDRLEYAREAFNRFACFYLAASKRRFGVSVEFY